MILDAGLDNFSRPEVIYLSLLSLAEAPALWNEYHDENLIFTKPDFENPRNSPLFEKIKRIGAEHKRLAEALEKACADDPKSCPSVLDLTGQRASIEAPGLDGERAVRDHPADDARSKARHDAATVTNLPASLHRLRPSNCDECAGAWGQRVQTSGTPGVGQVFTPGGALVTHPPREHCAFGSWPGP